MKLDYIFLDIDGVLNNYDSPYSDYDFTIKMEDEAIQSLEELIATYNTKIIISSTWRENKSLDYLKNLFGNYSEDVSNSIIDLTPQINFADRELEINTWLKDNEALNSKFIILDDRSDFQKLKGNLYLVDPYKGLKLENLQKIHSLIGKINKKGRFSLKRLFSKK